MKIMQTIHLRGDEDIETTDELWFEGNDPTEIERNLASLVFTLTFIGGLECIAKCPEEHWAVFADGLSKEAHWIKVSVI